LLLLSLLLLLLLLYRCLLFVRLRLLLFSCLHQIHDKLNAAPTDSCAAHQRAAVRARPKLLLNLKGATTGRSSSTRRRQAACTHTKREHCIESVLVIGCWCGHRGWMDGLHWDYMAMLRLAQRYWESYNSVNNVLGIVDVPTCNSLDCFVHMIVPICCWQATIEAVAWTHMKPTCVRKLGGRSSGSMKGTLMCTVVAHKRLLYAPRGAQCVCHALRDAIGGALTLDCADAPSSAPTH
jgi:hypothetical protein